MGISFRHSAGFGKRMEYNLVGKMLMEGLDVYLPLGGLRFIFGLRKYCQILKDVPMILRNLL